MGQVASHLGLAGSAAGGARERRRASLDASSSARAATAVTAADDEETAADTAEMAAMAARDTLEQKRAVGSKRRSTMNVRADAGQQESSLPSTSQASSSSSSSSSSSRDDGMTETMMEQQQSPPDYGKTASRPSMAARRMHSKSSSIGTIRASSYRQSPRHSRTSSDRSVATLRSPTWSATTSTSTAGKEAQDGTPAASVPNLSPLPRRRSFMDKLRSAGSRRTASDGLRPDTAPSMPLPPPPLHRAFSDSFSQDRVLQSDPDAADAHQAGLDAEQSLSSPDASSSQEIVIRAPNEDDALDPPECVIPITASPTASAFPSSPDSDMADSQPDLLQELTGSLGPSADADTPQAVLPGVAALSAPSATSREAAEPEPEPAVSGGTTQAAMGSQLADFDSEGSPSAGGQPVSMPQPVQPVAVSSETVADTEPAPWAHQPIAQAASPPAPAPTTTPQVTIPRRILVQGIVARAPARTPPAARTPPVTRTPPSRRTAPLPRRASPLPTPSAASPRSGSTVDESDAHASDSGFWGELPGAEAMLEDESSGSHSADERQIGSGEDSTWEDAVAELLALPTEESRSGRRRTAYSDGASTGMSTPVAEAETPDDTDSRTQQGALIGRLLSIAAAATAATLLPGAITMNGQTISGFDDSDGGMLTGAGASTASSSQANPQGAASNTAAPAAEPSASRPRSNSVPSAATRSAPASSPGPTRRQNSGSLQDILRNALAAAFRTPPASPPASPSLTQGEAVRSPLASPSPLTASNDSTTTEQSEGHTPSIAGSPASEESATSPASDPAPPSPAAIGTIPQISRPSPLAVPITALHLDPTLAHGRAQPVGTFERFLADMQTDIAASILRFQQDEDASLAAAVHAPAASSDGTEQRDNASPSSSSSNSIQETQPLLANAPEEARNPGLAADTLLPERTPRPTPPATAAAPARFTFFRSYRFPARPVASLVPEAAAAESATPAAPAESARPTSPVMPGSFAEERDDLEGGDTSSTNAPTDASSENPRTAPAAAAAPSPPPSMFGPLQVPTNAEVVPMLLVGVRSMTRPLADELADAGSGATAASSVGEAASPARTADPAPVDPADIPLPVDDDEDIAEEADDDELESVEPVGRPSSPPTPAPWTLPRTQPATPPPVSQGFVLWIMGGLYPSNHPLVIAPNLLSDDVLSYEDMLRLAEVLGSHKQPTATTDEIAKSDLQVIKGGQVGQYVEEEKILSITADRCLVCLEDYEADEDVRILACKHSFHQPCVDRWLSQGANTCPACRTAGVKKEAAAAAAVPAASGVAPVE